MRAVLDACVLYPTLVRDLLLRCAAAGLFAPLWSDRIVAEWRNAVLRRLPEQAAAVEAAIAAADRAFPAARIAADPELEASLALPDADDRHVLAAAITRGAGQIVTFNTTDFPGRTLARHGIVPRHPDGFLLELYRDAPDTVGPVATAALTTVPEPGTPRALLKKAKLPRLGKAVTPAAGPAT